MSVQGVPGRVGIASGSLAECWMLASGEVCAVTRDAEDRNLDLPEDVINLGALKEPSLEAILAADLDFLILMPNLRNHLSMAETLDKTGINYAYFDLDDFGDYLKLLKLFADITGRHDLYEANGAALIPQIEAALCTFFPDANMGYAAFRAGGLSAVQSSVLYPAVCLIAVSIAIMRLKACAGSAAG